MKIHTIVKQQCEKGVIGGKVGRNREKSGKNILWVSAIAPVPQSFTVICFDVKKA